MTQETIKGFSKCFCFISSLFIPYFPPFAACETIFALLNFFRKINWKKYLKFKGNERRMFWKKKKKNEPINLGYERIIFNMTKTTEVEGKDLCYWIWFLKKSFWWKFLLKKTCEMFWKENFYKFGFNGKMKQGFSWSHYQITRNERFLVM